MVPTDAAMVLNVATTWSVSPPGGARAPSSPAPRAAAARSRARIRWTMPPPASTPRTDLTHRGSPASSPSLDLGPGAPVSYTLPG